MAYFRLKVCATRYRVPPDLVLGESKLKSDEVVHLFQPYQSLEEPLALKRALAMLSPPINVTAAIDQSQLILTGYASEDWVAAINHQLIQTTGVTNINTQGLKQIRILWFVHKIAFIPKPLLIRGGPFFGTG